MGFISNLIDKMFGYTKIEFDMEALRKLTMIREHLRNAHPLDWQDMVCRALRDMQNCVPSFDEMTEEQRTKFQSDLLRDFEHKGWIKKKTYLEYRKGSLD